MNSAMNFKSEGGILKVVINYLLLTNKIATPINYDLEDIISKIKALDMTSYRGMYYRVDFYTSNEHPYSFTMRQTATRSNASLLQGILEKDIDEHTLLIVGKITSDISRYFIFYIGLTIMLIAGAIFFASLFNGSFETPKLAVIFVLTFIGFSAVQMPHSEQRDLKQYVLQALAG